MSDQTSAIRGTGSTNSGGAVVTPAITPSGSGTSSIRGTGSTTPNNSGAAPEPTTSDPPTPVQSTIQPSSDANLAAILAANQKKDNSMAYILPAIMQMIQGLTKGNPLAGMNGGGAGSQAIGGSTASGRGTQATESNPQVSSLNGNFNAMLKDPDLYKAYIAEANKYGANIDPSAAPSSANLGKAISTLTGEGGKPNAIDAFSDVLKDQGYKVTDEQLKTDAGIVARAIDGKQKPEAARSLDDSLSIE